MSHSKDIDQRAEPAQAPEAGDLALVDLLYGELDAGARQRAEQRVREDDALAGELEALTRIRSILRELPDEEPPEAISTKLLHAAAAAAAANRAADDEEQTSLWARLRRLFMPLMMHPGLAAAASLVLVGGVAGALYLSGGLKMAAVSHERAAAPAMADPQARPMAALEQATAGAAAPAMQNAAPPEPAGTSGLGGLVASDEAGELDRAEGYGMPGAAATGRAQAAEPAQDPRRRELPRRSPGNTELPADDFGAMEQGYFAEAPAEESEPAQTSRDKVARSGVVGGADLDDQVALGKNGSGATQRAREENKQKKEVAADRGGVSQPKAGDARLDELAGDLESGSSAGARGSVAGKTQSASGGASAGPPALAVSPPPAPSKAPARKPSPASVAAPAPAAERAPEPSTKDVAEDAPAERKPVAEGAKERERREGKATQASTLHQEALAAAARGDCATARAVIGKLRSLDPAYHRDRVARDERLQDCMAAKK
jgi:hypothetical protein